LGKNVTAFTNKTGIGRMHKRNVYVWVDDLPQLNDFLSTISSSETSGSRKEQTFGLA
jgi:hypothetical protein